MKKLLITMMSLMLMFGMAATADAASSDDISVTVTITAGAVDVSVSPGTWVVPNQSEGSSPNTIDIGPDNFAATNNRNSPEDLTLTVGSSGDWAADDTAAGADQFAMQFSIDEGTSWTTIVGAGSSLASNLAASDSETFDLQLLVPTLTTVGGTEQTITVTVTAS